MYIYITANSLIENLYKKLCENNLSININTVYRRVRYIIKFEEEPIDSRIRDDYILQIIKKETNKI